MNPLVATASPSLSGVKPESATVRSWLLTTDHRRISILYLAAATVFAMIALAAYGVTRLELATPAGDWVSPFVFGRLSSLHVLLISFFFALPAIPAVLGNALLPAMVGARGLAFPRLVLASWYLYVAGGALVLGAALTGTLEAGWAYAVTATQTAAPVSTASLVGLFLACLAMLLNGLNLVVTAIKLRSADVSWTGQSLFVWSLMAAGLIMVLSLPLFAMTLVLGIVENTLSLGLFDPAQGGDPAMLPQLAATFSAPATWLVLLPAMGIVSEVIERGSRRRLSARGRAAGCLVALAALSLLTLGGGMQTGDVPGRFSMIFGLFGFIVVVPFAMLVGQWLRVLRHGSVSIEPGMIYALGFVPVSTAGVLLGLWMSPMGLGSYLRGTEFGTAHFQYLLVGGSVLALLAALDQWWPSITGRTAPRPGARAVAVAILMGLHLTYIPLFVLGQLGLPAGHYAYPKEFQVYHVLSTAGGTIFAAGLLVTLVMFLATLTRPANADAED